MSNITNTNQTVNTNLQGFGAALTTARKKKSMSIDDVAKALKRIPRQIEAIEAEDYQSLPQYAFTKSFLVSYVRFMELDEDEIIRQFDAGYPRHMKVETVEEIKAPLQPMGTLHRGRTPIRLNFALIAGILAVVFLGIIMLKMVSRASKNEEVVAVQDVQVVDSLSLNEQAQGAAIGNVGTVINTPNSQGVAGLTAVLDFWVKQPTEIRVVDATGNVLMTGKQNGGGYQLSGKTPLTIEIDNPTQVDLNFNQNPVKLAEHTIGNKATLSLQ